MRIIKAKAKQFYELKNKIIRRLRSLIIYVLEPLRRISFLPRNFRIWLLLKKYRVAHVVSDYMIDGLRVNRLAGLKTLIEENLNENSVICEVGAYEGVSSELFALKCKQVYCVDVFCQDKYEREFDKVSNRYKNIIKIKKTSVEASKQFEDNFFDFVYLDAGHKYEDIKNDILCWNRKVKKGGLIGGHDYHKEEDVIRVVNQFYGVPRKVYEDSSWIGFIKTDV